MNQLEGTGTVQTEIRIGFGLPGTDVDHRFLVVIDVYLQEQIAGIPVVGRIIILLDLNTEQVFVEAFGELDHFNVRKFQVDVLLAVEAAA